MQFDKTPPGQPGPFVSKGTGSVTTPWPPQVSAVGLPEGYQRQGSTGQTWEVRDQQWVLLSPNGEDLED